MIPWVNSALSAWASWAVNQARREVGFSSISPMFRDAKPSRLYQSFEPGFTRSDMSDIDRAVMSLPGVLKVVVVEYYQRGQTADDAASRLGVRKSQMYRYIDQAHEQIAGAMATAEA